MMFVTAVYIILLLLVPLQMVYAEQRAAYDIGVYYYPGWQTNSKQWDDIKGTSNSRSPNRAWPEREPYLGYYHEEELSVTERHLDWAKQFGITFFAYDWYWDGSRPYLDHAINNYLRAKDRGVKFCILWANHGEVPKTQNEFDDMVSFWFNNYFSRPNYYRIDNMPVVFIFSQPHLKKAAERFGSSVNKLLGSVQVEAIRRGYKGIFFVANTNAKPTSGLERSLKEQGFYSYSPWNYANAHGKAMIADYDEMVDTYLGYFAEANRVPKLLRYIYSVSPGWDSRPAYGDKAVVRENPTPEKFERLLLGAKLHLDNSRYSHKLLMIEAWNEFVEGSYIEPTKKWRMKYLEAIQRVFGYGIVNR